MSAVVAMSASSAFHQVKMEANTSEYSGTNLAAPCAARSLSRGVVNATGVAGGRGKVMLSGWRRVSRMFGITAAATAAGTAADAFFEDTRLPFAAGMTVNTRFTHTCRPCRSECELA
jgi:hypothetical protein